MHQIAGETAFSQTSRQIKGKGKGGMKRRER